MQKMIRAFATMQDKAGKKWRVNISNHDTIEEAEKAIAIYKQHYKEGFPKIAYIGTHNYYTITKEEWEKAPRDYKGFSIRDRRTKTILEGAIPENHGKGGTTLLFEGLHFDIL